MFIYFNSNIISEYKEKVKVEEVDDLIYKDLKESLESTEEYSNEDLNNIFINGKNLSDRLISLDSSYNESFHQIDKELYFYLLLLYNREICHSIIHDNDKDMDNFITFLDSTVIPSSSDSNLINQNIINEINELYKEVKKNKEKYIDKQIKELCKITENKLKEYPHYSHESEILDYMNQIKKKINYDDYNIIYDKLDYINQRIDDYITYYHKYKDELVKNIQNILYIYIFIIINRQSYESKYKNYQRYIYDIKNIKEFIQEKSDKYSIDKYKENYYKIRDILNDMNDVYMVYNTKLTSLQVDLYLFISLLLL